jgi:peptidoglycan/LPS O-acetylase OafA/YrhL
MVAMPDQSEDAIPTESSPTVAQSAGTEGGNELPKRAPFRLGDRPALTGVRAVGVSLVLIFHSNFHTFPGSWVALGVFFVLSGFLITTMLATEHQKTGGISLSKFYYRRGVRLLPPLFLTVGLLALYALIVPVQNASQRIWGDAAAAVFYFADYRAAFGHEPFAPFLAQCWSLAVEEQFYLIWAALLLVTLKFGNRKLAYAMAVTGIVACSVNRYRIVFEAAHWNSYVAGRVYYAFDTRADALFLGCLLGLIATGGHLEGWKPWAKRTLTVLALISTGIMVWIIWSVTLAPRSLPLLWLPVSEVASALIIAYFIVQPQGWGTRLMGIPILVFFGNMSYTIYLIHWPIYVAISPFTVKWSYWLMDPVRFAIIFPLAIASWYLMERPLMHWRRDKLDPTKSSAVPTPRISPADERGTAIVPPASPSPPTVVPISSTAD